MILKILTIIVPTYNEEKNIQECLDSLKGVECDIFVMDSFSTDQTKEMAEAYNNAIVIQESWATFAEKINWAMQNLPIRTPWVMRLDADERMSEKLKRYIISGNLEKSAVDVYAIKRRFVFMGRLFSFGGLGSLWDIRIWRHGCVTMESRLLDEHMIVDGKLKRLNLEIIDHNNKPIHEWISKHNGYASKEAQSYFNPSSISGHSELSAKIKRFLKNSIYYRAPLFVRPFGNFIYRYIFLFGFLDGVQGLIFHVLHSFWYRFLVDVKIFEMKYLNDNKK